MDGKFTADLETAIAAAKDSNNFSPLDALLDQARTDAPSSVTSTVEPAPVPPYKVALDEHMAGADTAAPNPPAPVSVDTGSADSTGSASS